jgi:ESX secretion-associated protein EspD/H
VNGTQQLTVDDGDGYLAALDFGDEYVDDCIAALDFGDDYVDDHPEHSALEVLDTYPGDGDGEIPRELATVTNPEETVSATAILSGEVQQIELSPTVVRTMTASELADEILVIANLARQQAHARQYAVILQSLDAPGANDGALSEYLEKHLGLSSPKQADEAQAKVFAARYASQAC